MKVLFLCTGNSCRSQMGEILLRRLKPDWQVFSAGVEAHGLNSRMLRVMEESGKIPKNLHSKTLDDLATMGHSLGSFDWIITLCGDALDRCPRLPQSLKHEHWGLPDPAQARGNEAQILNQFRSVRDELQRRLKEWIAGLG